MKGLGVFGLISLLLVTVLGLYSCTIMQEFEAVEREIQDDYLAAGDALRAIKGKTEIASDAPFQFKAREFDAWLAVREPVAGMLQAPIPKNQPATNIQLRRLRNRILNTIAASLPTHNLSFAEYCAISKRWQAILARPEFAKLQEEWNQRVRVSSDPNPLPLPAPATDATKEELSLVTTNSVRLAASLEADKLTKLLETILME